MWFRLKVIELLLLADALDLPELRLLITTALDL